MNTNQGTNMLPILNASFVENLKSFLNNDIEVVGAGRALRAEYQPSVIARLVQQCFKDEDAALKTHIGCGGGKTVIFISAIIMTFLYGKAQRAVITAPTIALTRQIEIEFMKYYKAFYEKGRRINNLCFLNVSSDGKNAKDSGLSEEEFTFEHDGLEDIEDEEKKSSMKEADILAEALEIHRSTSMDCAVIEEHLVADVNTIFFVCKPSFCNNFRYRVKDSDVRIDITVFDEYHNFISQDNVEKKSRIALEEYSTLCQNRWYFSASKKHGQVFSWKHEVFGEEIANVSTSQLVNWGYLVRNLRVFLVTAEEVRGITNTIREFFAGIDIKNPEKFYAEASIIMKVMMYQAQMCVPQAVVFASKVKFIQLMKASLEFKESINNLFDIEAQIHQIDGSTKTCEREEIFNILRNLPNEAPSLLLNHSTVKEGIDVTKFNTAIITRAMSQHSLQQALGRIQRVDYGNPDKDTCYLYLYIDGDNDGDLKKKCQKFMTNLHYGLGDWEGECESIPEGRVGDEQPGQTLVKNIGDLPGELINVNTDIVEDANEELKRIRDAEALADLVAIVGELPASEWI